MRDKDQNNKKNDEKCLHHHHQHQYHLATEAAEGLQNTVRLQSTTIRKVVAAAMVALFDCDFDKLKSVFYSCIHITMLISLFFYFYLQNTIGTRNCANIKIYFRFRNDDVCVLLNGAAKWPRTEKKGRKSNPNKKENDRWKNMCPITQIKWITPGIRSTPQQKFANKHEVVYLGCLCYIACIRLVWSDCYNNLFEWWIRVTKTRLHSLKYRLAILKWYIILQTNIYSLYNKMIEHWIFIIGLFLRCSNTLIWWCWGFPFLIRANVIQRHYPIESNKKAGNLLTPVIRPIDIASGWPIDKQKTLTRTKYIRSFLWLNGKPQFI